MSAVTARAISWTEAGLVPDSVIRRGIRRLLDNKLAEIRAGDVEFAADTLNDFVDMMHESPIALVPELANVELACPARVISLDAGEDACRLRVDREGVETTIEARLLVGADGEEIDRYVGYLDPERFIEVIGGYQKGIGTVGYYEEQLKKNPNDVETLFALGSKHADAVREWCVMRHDGESFGERLGPVFFQVTAESHRTAPQHAGRDGGRHRARNQPAAHRHLAVCPGRAAPGGERRLRAHGRDLSQAQRARTARERGGGTHADDGPAGRKP